MLQNFYGSKAGKQSAWQLRAMRQRSNLPEADLKVSSIWWSQRLQARGITLSAVNRNREEDSLERNRNLSKNTRKTNHKKTAFGKFPKTQGISSVLCTVPGPHEKWSFFMPAFKIILFSVLLERIESGVAFENPEIINWFQLPLFYNDKRKS